MPSRFRRHFLPWDRPWLPQAAAWLAGDWACGGALDLSDVLAIVPTRQAARRLREALAGYAAERGSAVFPPQTLTPDMLLRSAEEDLTVASRLEALLAWAEVLQRIDLEEVDAVFPVAPPRRDFAWAWRLAENFDRLQMQLNEAGLAIADVAARAGADFPETDRWLGLARLEALHASALAARGRREPHAARRAFALRPPLPTGVRRIVLLASPDPLSLALDALAVWAESLPVDVVVFAPAEEAEAFDTLGRPIPSHWAARPIMLPEFERRVHLCADSAQEAARVVAIARGYREPDGMMAVGAADADTLPLLESEFNRADLPVYNPEGRMRRGGRLHTLLMALATLARDPAIATVAALARCPDFLICLETRDGVSPAAFLTQLDDTCGRHLPADLAALKAAISPKSPELARGVALVEDLRAALIAEPFPRCATAALAVLFQGRRFDLTVPADAAMAAAAEAWREAMHECAALTARFPQVAAADWWEIALHRLGETREAGEKPAGALDLQGWLELLWEDAPHLVVAGLNDGVVPEAIVGDAFLPESLREKLGLKTNAVRFARDSYLVQALAAARGAAGRLDVLLAKFSAAGDPLRPSRLLLQCADKELPNRIDFLFRTLEPAQSQPAWTRAWRLRPPRPEPIASVAVTGLRSWLECPFRFWLRHGLKMEPADPEKRELDARDFGTLCHAALEALAREEALRDCTDEEQLREFLIGALARVARRRFGSVLTLPVIVQLESARQRLARVAAVLARERAEGWVIERVEWPFALEIAGLAVRGKIDRIDRHEGTGARRVLDYKTSDSAKAPVATHLRTARGEERALPDWRRVAVGKKELVWIDLQLPVYLRAVAAAFPGETMPVCGYVNLPKAAGETALAAWPELAGELLAAAHACTDGVAAAVRAGEFWPPAEIKPDADDFAALFHRGAAESIEWEAAP
ncbi:MAG: PD-(D/E)XK nuclease family protein [Opitutaceae bacterium]|nr:PD-(D/E)XK nuclease family protein [Opitutaceae bacterium]